MITLEQHIEELRAELRCCVMTRHERAEAESELAAAMQQQRADDREFDKAFATEIRGRGG
ncbi:hypothetical protein [Acidocella sp.]|uniref:hypothetical protein n=1 Tax=Acidocella sp. TaxID=50710 RepID=UPI002614B0E4|nr:hypothetical protein [Acidocella sp.]